MGPGDVITGKVLRSANTAFSDSQVEDTLQLLVGHGVKHGANTIHIEPNGQFVLVRYRIDGALRGFHRLPLAASKLLTEKLKTLADLEPGHPGMPQEGHFTTETEGQPVYVRLSVMPVLGGERAVLHLIRHNSPVEELASLGFWGANIDTLHEVLARPQGLITVSGPKHSGKSTTLYGMLQLLHSPTHSLATIEEHHTHQLSGISQTYVHPKTGAGFAKTLQAVLQQDPNIILIGKLPDRETTELAIHAAATGHLLLAELYADDAVTSALHLRSMTNAPFLLATALRATISQRLVRMLCQHCRERYDLNDAKRQKLEKAFGITSSNARARVAELEQTAKRAGLSADDPLASSPTGITHVWRARKGGCEACDHTGYNGRLALTEVLQNNDAIQKKLLSQATVTPADLHQLALRNNFIPMGLDGLIKALRGLTTVVDVLRAVSIREI